MSNLQCFWIECGHGKGNMPFLNDPGANRVYNGKKITEREIILQLGKNLSSILSPKLLGRVHEVNTLNGATYSARRTYINKVMKDCKFDPKLVWGVAIHVNSFVGGEGCESWYQQGKDKTTSANLINFSRSILDSEAEYNQFKVRGVYPTNEHKKKKLYIDDYPGNWILLETFFLTNDKELQHYLDNPYRVAESIAHGIMEYFRKSGLIE